MQRQTPHRLGKWSCWPSTVVPGCANWRACLVDGYTTSSSPGTGLGAVARASQFFDVFSSPGKGTIALARVASDPRVVPPVASQLEVGAICVALAGELQCGDAWAFQRRNGGMQFLVADGLGHGGDAAKASHAAVDSFGSLDGLRPSEIMSRIHGGIRHTRGAAAAAVELDASQKEVRSLAGSATSRRHHRRRPADVTSSRTTVLSATRSAGSRR